MQDHKLLGSLFRDSLPYPRLPTSVWNLYCFKGLIMLVFHVKTKKNTQPFYRNKQGAAILLSDQRVRYCVTNFVANIVCCGKGYLIFQQI